MGGAAEDAPSPSDAGLCHVGAGGGCPSGWDEVVERVDWLCVAGLLGTEGGETKIDGTAGAAPACCTVGVAVEAAGNRGAPAGGAKPRRDEEAGVSAGFVCAEGAAGAGVEDVVGVGDGTDDTVGCIV